MQTENHGRKWTAQLLASIAVGVAVLGFTPGLADATMMTYYWTSAQGSGFIAYTAASRNVDLTIESDVVFAYTTDWYGNSASNASSVEINTHIGHCSGGGSYTISTQHTATDPVTSEYEWQSSGASGSC